MRERLEEIEVKYSTLTVSSEKNSTEYTEVDVKDLVFLIQNGFEQAERVQELEETNKKNYWIAADFKFENLKLEQQNKRYKQALEEISNADWNSEGLDAERELDKVTDLAIKALEGEK